MNTTQARERAPNPANRVLAANGGSWPNALARALKAPVKDRSRPDAAATGDLPAYSLSVRAGFAPGRR